MATLTVVLLFVVAAVPAGAMTVTFIRHGESLGNASGYINTLSPGPGLTGSPSDDEDDPTGWGQSKKVAAALAASGVDYDSIYVSSMLRTQQTAEASEDALDLDVHAPLDGFREIGAGIFEGSPEDSGIGRIGYIFASLAWTLGLRFVRIPGSENGNEFDARVDDAIGQIEADGNDTPVVFSHGATIMFWTMMNVDNPNLLLILEHPLDNTDVVVVESNGEGGWTLTSWAGTPVAPASYPIKMFVNVRDLVVAPQTAIYNLREPVLALDTAGVVAAAGQGVTDVAGATVKFARDSVTDTVDAISGLIPGSQAVQSISSTDAVEAKESTSTAAENALTDAKSKVKAFTQSLKSKDSSKLTAATDNADQSPGKASKRLRSTVQDVNDQVAARLKTSVKNAEKAGQKVAKRLSHQDAA